MKTVAYLGNIWEYPKALAAMPGVRLAGLVYEDEQDIDAALGYARAFGAKAFRVSSDADARLAFESLGPIDLVLMANFGILLSETSLGIPSAGVINFHPGTLPDQAGRAPISKLWSKGGGLSALTIHRAVPKADAGPILATYPYQVDAKLSLDQNLSQVYRLGISFFPQLIAL
jgi:methionyl-tRNA formyltransferase